MTSMRYGAGVLGSSTVVYNLVETHGERDGEVGEVVNDREGGRALDRNGR